jgi:plasmid stabilization system protein ParE
MKQYQVLFSPEAREEALIAAEYIRVYSPVSAARWYEGLERVIEALSSFPKRCPLAPEEVFLGQDLRHYVYRSHRIIFRIEEDSRTVRILHIHHARQRTIGEAKQESL